MGMLGYATGDKHISAHSSQIWKNIYLGYLGNVVE